MLVRSKLKYRTRSTSTFKSKTSNGGGRKKLSRADKTNIHLPKKAVWASSKAAGGHWWSVREKGRHRT